MTKYFRKKQLSLSVQDFHVVNRFRNFKGNAKRNIVRWRGIVQPTPASVEYEVQISYVLGQNPKVIVLSPKLKLLPNATKLPHVYEGEKLCLYLPWIDWNEGDVIAETIIPWISLWLYYYELWHATNEWLGGGIHPPIKEFNQS